MHADSIQFFRLGVCSANRPLAERMNTHEQIASNHNVAVGSLGVYLKRGLEAMRKQGARHPKLLKELEAYLR